MDDSVITCNEVINWYDEKIRTIPTNFNEKNITCKTQSFYILLSFLLITITLLIAVSIYCYLIKYQAKNLLPFHHTENILNKFCIDSINWKWVLKILLIFDDIINTKDFDLNNIKIKKKSYKKIFIYYVGYVTIKNDLKIYNVNPLYLIFGEVNRYF